MQSKPYPFVGHSGISLTSLPKLTSTCFKAAIFDLDGTLVNSEEPCFLAMQGVLNQRGVNWPSTMVRSLLYGRSWFDIYRGIELQAPGLFSDVRDLIDSVENRMFSEKTEPTLVYGSVRLLSCLAKLIPTSIVSGSSRARVLGTAATLGIIPDLAHCLGFEDYDKGKPSPSGFQEAARRMGVESSSCVVFEDSTVGVTSARRAGMFCIALRRPDAPDQDLSNAHLVTNDLCSQAVLDALN